MADALRGLLVGLISGICVIYAFQTKVIYPQWVLKSWDHPWVFVVLVVIALSIAQWSVEISALTLLCLAAVIGDKLVFGQPKKQKSKEQKVATNESQPEFNSGILDTYGEPLDTIELEQPEYPLFYGLEDAQSGPAPF